MNLLDLYIFAEPILMVLYFLLAMLVTLTLALSLSLTQLHSERLVVNVHASMASDLCVHNYLFEIYFAEHFINDNLPPQPHIFAPNNTTRHLDLSHTDLFSLILRFVFIVVAQRIMISCTNMATFNIPVSTEQQVYS